MYKLIRPLLFRHDAEQMHDAAIAVGKRMPYMPIQLLYGYEHASLHTHVLDMDFSNPIGLAAGFDKNGELVHMLPALGFGFLEIGSVSSQPCMGNPKPRLFRLPDDEAVINRMGLNNIGADALAERLRPCTIPMGINIVKTHDPSIMGDKAIEDIAHAARKLAPYASYIALNLSCPNTQEGKTFEDAAALEELLPALDRSKPLLLKLSPGIQKESLDALLGVAERHHVDGYILTNTTAKREQLRSCQNCIAAIGKGGLSGKPLATKATECIAYVSKHLNKPMIIGIGGIFSGEDAYAKIRAGASLVQVFTGLVYEGPGLVKRIKKGLVTLLQRDGFSAVHEAVGTYR
ncbi:quinone-dependent dihydroorotate dehydrogenase [Candidatus Woesearchaeota archaeon]|nr:quinone-dependent dihydroorotate dehydrogenase [Candidatus Woesearchaeota archaeon]